MSDWMIQILESKRIYRTKLAALPFAEKVVLQEQLRQWSLMIGAARPRERRQAANLRG
jgi:hypothetical protein